MEDYIVSFPAILICSVCTFFICMTVLHEVGHYLTLKFFSDKEKIKMTFTYTYSLDLDINKLSDKKLKICFYAGAVSQYCCSLIAILVIGIKFKIGIAGGLLLSGIWLCVMTVISIKVQLRNVKG